MIEVALKTVETFSRITGKELHLKDHSSVFTDGSEIFIPFDHPYFYTLVEHELAHIVFDSDHQLRERFVADAAKKMSKGKKDLRECLEALLDVLICILDDYRVDALWGEVYKGSSERILKMRVEELSSSGASDSIAALVLSSCLGLDIESIYSGVKPYIEKAKLQVRGAGFYAVLVASKDLLHEIISFVQLEIGACDPVVALSPVGNASGLPEPLEDIVKDVRSPTTGGRARAPKPIQKLAETLAKGKVTSSEVVALLQEDTEKVRRGLESLQLAVREGPAVGEYVCKLRIERIRGAPDRDLSLVPGALEEEAQAMQLRAHFERVLGRRRAVLSEEGSELDVSAFIQRRATGRDLACFKDEASVRGFHAAILLDRSGSMLGEKSAKAERACRILRGALTFPGVEVDVFGFKQDTAGVMKFFEFDRDDKSLLQFGSAQSATPLHAAIGAAAASLRERIGKKVLFVVTDGAPSIRAGRGERTPSTAKLVEEVASQVALARKSKIDVYALLIGRFVDRKHYAQGDLCVWDATEANMFDMFGPANYWTMAPPDAVEESLVRLVSGTFSVFLRR